MEQSQKVKEFLEKVEKQKEAIDIVINSDEKSLIFTSDRRYKLDELQKHINPIYEKLKKNEFEIAVVGQEDTGKSSLLNALIKTDIFPSASGTTTYTSTKLMYGEKDRVEIIFYSESEFKENLNNRLKSIGIDKVALNSLNLKVFDEKFKRLTKSQKDNAKDNNNYNEIKEIINEKSHILDILKEKDGKTKIFEDENFEEFKEYITGEKNNKSKPRAVKSITIYSSELKELKTAIIYDVPGFNSPTKLHKEQTQEMLKKADSIIFISDVSSPNFKGDELDLLLNSKDEYEISLKDKLFVFGNKLDKANNKDESVNNQEKFTNDLKEKLEINENIFIGSAGKYLVDNKIGNLNITFNYEVNDTIDSFRKAIKKYYQTNRFDVLKTKIENNQERILEIFDDIKESISIEEKIEEGSERDRIVYEYTNSIKPNIENYLNKYIENLENELDEYFTKEFQLKINSYFQKIDKSDLLNTSTSLEKTNHYFRDKLYNKFIQEFSQLTKEVVQNKSDEIEKNIKNGFIGAISENKNRKIKRLVEDLFSKFKFEKQDNKFDYLFERFGKKLLKIMIFYPVYPTSQERKNEFKKYRDEFILLDNSSKDKNGSILHMIVTGKNKSLETLSNKLKYFKEKSINSLEKIIESRENYVSFFEKDLLQDLDNILNIAYKNNVYDETQIFNIEDTEDIEITLEDIQKEINNDIINFKLILKETVVPILNLENIYSGRVEKEIKRLIKYFNSNEYEATSFITKISRILAKDELSKVDEKIQDQESKKTILDKVDEFLENNE
ncbi:MAG: dynamin family protein [Campylobacterota bacterium]|nr:dynamin family protein [Campylobacterota bacterium]